MTIGTRVKWAVQALQNAGFDSITDFIETVNLERFAPGTTCHRIQKFEWEEGLPKMLGLIYNHSKNYPQWRHYDWLSQTQHYKIALRRCLTLAS